MMSWTAIAAARPGPAALCELNEDDLPEGDVTVAVKYSSLNYKDGLAVTGRGKVIRNYPMVCGIDLAGVVEASDSPQWREGDEVIATGWGLSDTHPGGYTSRQRLPAQWLMARPDELSLRETMAIGTAGLTAMFCVQALQHNGVSPENDAEVLVTGAGGGVGSMAVFLLARRGFRVVASTGRESLHDYLAGIGASAIIDRSELSRPSRPLESERWAGAVDTVGGETLACVLAQTRYGGSVAACGLVGGSDLQTTVLPFILRNVNLLGVNAVTPPVASRASAWRQLGRDLSSADIAELSTTEPLAKVPELAEDILAGKIRGRVVIDTTGGA